MKKKFLHLILLSTILLMTVGGAVNAVESAADTVLVNGEFYTVDAENSWAEAVAIEDSTIVYVGSMEGVDAFIGAQTKVIDLEGKFAMPSFVDSHMHPLWNAYAFQFLAALFDQSTHAEYIETITEYAENHPELDGIMGAGFDRTIYGEIGPRKEWLDAIDSERPIGIVDIDIHCMWVNSKVFEMLGWDASTPDPPGGVIVRDPETGELTGLLVEMPAMEPAWELFPSPTKQDYKTSLLWLQDWLNAEGITTAHDGWMEFDPNYFRAYNELANEGNLTVRWRGSWYIDPNGEYPYMEDINYGLWLSQRFNHPHFQAHSFYFLADGTVETETALLLEPYTHRPDYYGIKYWEDEDMVNAFTRIDQAGHQIHVHAIGDGATKYVLDAFEQAGVNDNNRHSLAHTQLARSEDVARMGELGISAHMSQYWMVKDSHYWGYYLPYLGPERANEMYPHQSLFDADVNVTVASDFVTSYPDVMMAIYNGMTRSYPGGPQLPPASERVSLEEMLRAATINGAYANFLEDEVGSIQVGKKADIVVLSQNLFDIDTDEIPNVEIEMTFFEGELVSGSLEPSAVRVPAEWELHQATWMQWPGRWERSNRANFADIIDALQEYEPVNILVNDKRDGRQARNYLKRRGVPLANINWHIIPHNWNWMRDNGPVWATDEGGLFVQDWGFDGWGGWSWPWGKDDAVPCQVADKVGVRCDTYSLINERGTLEFNGADTLIASWSVLSDRNPGVTQGEMEQLFQDAFGVTQVVWLLHGPSDDQTDGHVDGIARFINQDTVAVARFVDQDDPNAWVFEEAAAIIQDAGLNVVRVDIPGYVQYQDTSISANYMNWLVANGVVVMMEFGNPEWDQAAKQTVEGFFPGRDVVAVETLDIWLDGGGIHCVTNDQPSVDLQR